MTQSCITVCCFEQFQVYFCREFMHAVPKLVFKERIDILRTAHLHMRHVLHLPLHTDLIHGSAWPEVFDMQPELHINSSAYFCT